MRSLLGVKNSTLNVSTLALYGELSFPQLCMCALLSVLPISFTLEQSYAVTISHRKKGSYKMHDMTRVPFFTMDTIVKNTHYTRDFHTKESNAKKKSFVFLKTMSHYKLWL